MNKTNKNKGKSREKSRTKKAIGANRKNKTKHNVHKIPQHMLIGGNAEPGPYLARLINKPPNEPITSGELKQALEEIIAIMNQVKYTKEGQQFSVGTTLLQYFTGDQQALESYLRYRVMPQYVRIFPPYINISGIWNKINEMSFFANAYMTDKQFKEAALIANGADPANFGNKNSFSAKLINNLSTASQKFNRHKRTFNLK